MRGRCAPGPLILALLGGLLLVGGLAQSAAAQLVFTPASLSAQIAVKGTAFSLTLPTAAHRTDTTGSVTAYSISPALPTGLRLDTMDITTPKITGTPSETTDGATDYTLTATYTFTDSTTTSATLTFSLAVKNIAFVDGTTAPHFPRLILTLPWVGTGCTTPLAQHALPTAAGQGTVTYTLDDDNDTNTPLDLPTGLSFNADPPRIDVDNTQIAVTTDATTYTLKATDAATPTANTTTLIFDLEVVNEKAILENFYTLTGGDDWSTKTNWESSISICPGQLHGVTAANGRVTEINLDHNNLTGPLPKDLGKLANLIRLYLNDNNLTGALPDLSGLTKSRLLYLYNNQLTGTLNVSDLTALRDLQLNDNQLTSVDGLSSLTGLTSLNLRNNQLTGVLDVSGLTELRQLFLDNNQLTSVGDLSGLTELIQLYLYRNQLTSVGDLSSMTRLTQLLLNSNQLAGTLNVSGLTALRQLWLHNNQLTGLNGLSGLSSLQRLYLTNNQLTDVNDLSGLSGLSSLQRLYLNRNQLAGDIDLSALSGLSSLQSLVLSDNQLTGVVNLSGLSSLQYLYLHRNQLGSIDLSGLSSLVHLRLYNNRLTNVANLSGLSNLQHVNLQHNQLTSAPTGPTGVPLWLYGNAGVSAADQLPTVSLSVSPTAVPEGGGTQTLEVTATLSPTVASDVAFKVVVVSGTADAGRDFTPPTDPFSLTIPANNSTVTTTTEITLVDDRQQESSETAKVELQTYPSDPSVGLPATVQPGDSATVTIRDNDGGGGGISLPRDDHGNSSRRATQIAPTSRTAGRLHTRSDVDYFTFTAPHAGVLVVETTGSTDTRGTVWQDSAILARADSGGTWRNFRLSARFEAGPVVIAVRGNGRRTGHYILQTALVVFYVENLPPTSFQSGLGVISGWVCEGEGVTIEIEQANGEVVELETAYGTERTDTAAICGDTDNGFGLLFNWNLLGDGAHEVRVLVNGVVLGRRIVPGIGGVVPVVVDGIELGRTRVTVTTLGAEFREGLAGAFVVADFPRPGEQVHLVWQESRQNFVLAPVEAGAALAPAQKPRAIEGVLENPTPASYQSGIGIISGWVCEADEVVIEIDGQTFTAAVGTERADTLDMCGDVDNGFGLLVNWAEFGAGTHEVVVLVDGVELSRATVTVTVVDATEPYGRGLVKRVEVAGFPTSEETVTLEWQQSQQNFVITGVD